MICKKNKKKGSEGGVYLKGGVMNLHLGEFFDESH